MSKYVEQRCHAVVRQDADIPFVPRTLEVTDGVPDGGSEHPLFTQLLRSLRLVDKPHREEAQQFWWFRAP